MIVLSLFDGISCGQLALQRAGIPYDTYFASEVDPSSLRVTNTRFPKTIQLGDVYDLDLSKLPKIDLLIGGPPCQAFSTSGDMRGFEDPRADLTRRFTEILHELQPTYFLMENVVGRGTFKKPISDLVGCEPVQMNSKLVSAQNRDRYYWTNIPNVTQPEDRKIVLRDVLDPVVEERHYAHVRHQYMLDFFREHHLEQVAAVEELHRKKHNFTRPVRLGKVPPHGQAYRIFSLKGKSNSVLSRDYGSFGNSLIVFWPYENGTWTLRKLAPHEYERLQTIPDGYTDVGLRPNRRGGVVGNAWTVDIIAHLLKGLA